MPSYAIIITIIAGSRGFYFMKVGHLYTDNLLMPTTLILDTQMLKIYWCPDDADTLIQDNHEVIWFSMTTKCPLQKLL